MKTQTGYGMIEILISLFLASIILTGLMQLYLSIKGQYYRAQDQLARQFDVQWLSDLMSDSIRRAGFTPCLGIERLETIDRRTSKPHISKIKIANASIQVNRMSERFNRIKRFKNSSQLLISADTPLKLERPVLIADCEHAEVHQLVEINKQLNTYQVTLSKPLIFHYTEPVYIGEWFEERWFIKTNKEKIDSLYYKLFQTEALSASVHSLHIERHHNEDKELIELILGLDQGKTQQLLVALRGT